MLELWEIEGKKRKDEYSNLACEAANSYLVLKTGCLLSTIYHEHIDGRKEGQTEIQA